MRPQHPQLPMSEEDRKLAAATVELARQQGKNFDKAVLMIELRKWCVEQALKGCNADTSAPAFIMDQTGIREPARVEFAAVVLAREIFGFVSAPIQE
jgi:hypothetical protein